MLNSFKCHFISSVPSLGYCIICTHNLPGSNVLLPVLMLYAQSAFLVANVLLLGCAKLLGRFVSAGAVSYGVAGLAFVVAFTQFHQHYMNYPFPTQRYVLV